MSCSRTVSIIIVAMISGDIPKPPHPIAGNAKVYEQVYITEIKYEYIPILLNFP